jgi:hypothetical protein
MKWKKSKRNSKCNCHLNFEMCCMHQNVWNYDCCWELLARLHRMAWRWTCRTFCFLPEHLADLINQLKKIQKLASKYNALASFEFRQLKILDINFEYWCCPFRFHLFHLLEIVHTFTFYISKCNESFNCDFVYHMISARARCGSATACWSQSFFFVFIIDAKSMIFSLSELIII